MRRTLEAGELPELTVAAGMRIGAPVARPQAVLCIGMNYAAHARETGAEPPKNPVLFYKARNTVVGPDDDVIKPRGSTKLDYEVELAVVMGRRARYLGSVAEARACIAGYVLSDDVSERAFQIDVSGGQWSKGKSAETFNPLGPWLVTPDEVPPTESARSGPGSTASCGRTPRPATSSSTSKRSSSTSPSSLCSRPATSSTPVRPKGWRCPAGFPTSRSVTSWSSRSRGSVGSARPSWPPTWADLG